MSQGRKYMQEADGKARSGPSIGTRFFGGGRQDFWEGVAETYMKAGSSFSMEDQDNEAGMAYERAAEIQKDPNTLGQILDAAGNYQEASKFYRKVNPQKSADCLQKTVQLYLSEGKPNFYRTANIYQKLAEIKEIDLQDIPAAIKDYEEAARLFDREDKPSKIHLKVADLVAERGGEGDYHKAIGLYENVATLSVANNLMKYSVKDYLLKAGICQLASGDMVSATRALEKFRDLDPTFPGTREHQLLVDLTESVQAGDPERFAEQLFKYDQVSKLDPWKTKILLRIKNNIEEAGEDFS